MASVRRRVLNTIPEGPRGKLLRARREILERKAEVTGRVRNGTAPVTGMVERFAETQVAGWVMVPSHTPATPVTLHLGSIQLSSTYPTPDGALSAMIVTKEDQGPPTAQEAAKHRRVVGGGTTAGRPDGRRNIPAGYEQRAFSFQVRAIWDYLSKGDTVTIRFGDQPLPIVGHGMFFRAPKKGRSDLKTLQQRLDKGFTLTQTGGIALSKRLDEEWQRRIAGIYAKVREVVGERFGHDVFVIYGTLLGSVREGGYIGHDADFDSAFISDHRTGPEAAEEIVAIALALLDAGLEVDLRQRVLHVHDPEDRKYRIDLFHLYFDPEGRLRFPWGIAGTRAYTTADYTGTELVDFPGGKVLRPKNPEPLVAHIYGDDWKLPKPGFHWSHARRDVADDGVLTTAQRDKVYWSNFYARHSNTEGSTFFGEVSKLDDLPDAVIDIGCGDGRDSCAFGQIGRSVLGIDQSGVAVEGATARAKQLGVGERATFEVCDVSDSEALGKALQQFRDQHEGSVLFYLRFFLHSIKAEVQEDLLSHIRAVARDGDLFAAEFRTDEDEKLKKTFGNHYRRFQNAAEFRSALEGRFGFDVITDQESDGLSPYGDEDPILYRVVARYRG